MLQGKKLKPCKADDHIRCAAKGFPVKQCAKRRLRPVFEPLNNGCIDRNQLPPLTYPSRAERRREIAGARYFWQFDFAAWYDQLPLDESVQDCYVIRSREPIEWEGQYYTLFALTREPMGASHSAHVAQTGTWAIAEPIIRMADVYTATMIDNVGIGSNNPRQFINAFRTFIERCRAFGATLNDASTLPVTDEEILARAEKKAGRHEIFLGEQYLADGTVQNTQRNVDKLRAGYQHIQHADRVTKSGAAGETSFPTLHGLSPSPHWKRFVGLEQSLKSSSPVSPPPSRSSPTI